MWLGGSVSLLVDAAHRDFQAICPGSLQGHPRTSASKGQQGNEGGQAGEGILSHSLCQGV